MQRARLTTAALPRLSPRHNPAGATLAHAHIQLRAAWAETCRSKAMRFIDTPRRDHNTAVIGVPRGVGRVH